MVSIVIPLYNKEKLIANTLRAVLGQTYQDFEIVIVNDGSTDNSVAEVNKIADRRIRLINQANAGVSAARNRGIEEARGEYIALLDADDQWLPEYLATQMRLSEAYPECDVFVTDYQFRDEFGKMTPTTIRNLPFRGEHGVLSNYFKVASTSNPPICSISIVARKKSFNAIGGFPLGITSGEDLLTWARLACRNKIAYSTKALAVYYTPTTGPTGQVPADLKSTKDAVGRGLMELLDKYPESGVKEYAAFWYKMRASINVRHRNRLAAAKCAAKSISLTPFKYKPWVILALTVMPGMFIDKAMGR